MAEEKENAKPGEEKKSDVTDPADRKTQKKTKPALRETLPSLMIASSPHTVAPLTIEKIMYMVALALLPACIASIYLFGLKSLTLIATSVIACLFFELIMLRLFQPQNNWRRTVLDGSAIVTGMLLAMNLSASAPLWLVIVGAFAAMLVGKHVYGGLGQNTFNPALVGRVFLLISFPKYMTQWVAARGDIVDAASYATPLGILQMEGAQKTMALSKLGLFLGQRGGCLGETCVLALLLGGLILLFTGIIRWHIPVSYIATVFIFTGIFWLINPGKYADPVFHILTGGLMLGAIFMATDMVTSPITGKGMIVFGIGCGLLTGIIRLFGSYPEGVSFSILIMNGLTPMIDRYIKGKRYGIKPAALSPKPEG